MKNSKKCLLSEMKNILSILLCFVLIVNLIVNVTAVIAETETDQKVTAEIVGEMEELRTPSSKTYELSDGSYRYVSYAEDVHYLGTDKQYHEIDTSLVRSRDAGFLFKNAANSWDVSFGEKEIKIAKDAYSINMSLPKGHEHRAVEPAKNITDRKAAYFEEKKNADNAVVYAYKGFDIVYTVLTGAVKEDIVIYEKNAVQSYTFELKLGKELRFIEKECYQIIDETGETIYKLSDLYMYDAKGKESDAISVDWRSENDSVFFTIKPDEAFFNDETAYPVIIDPSISVKGSSSSYDTYVDEIYPNRNYHLDSKLWTGGAAGYNTKRTFIYFSLPSINGGKITRARIRLKKMADNSPTIHAYCVDQVWSADSVTWNDQPSFDSSYWSAAAISEGSNWYSVDVTNMIEYYLLHSNWYHGFVLKEMYENNSNQKTRFYSANASTSYIPVLTVDYVNYYGSRPYQDNISPDDLMLVNCMGYALEYFDTSGSSALHGVIEYTDIGVQDSDLNGMTKEQILDYVAEMAWQWMKSSSGLGTGNVRKLSSYDASISSTPPGSFRVVMRIGFRDKNNNNKFDYSENPQFCDEFDFHWWYQTNELHGCWAEKQGQGTTHLMTNTRGIDPASIVWPHPSGTYNYDSTCRYFEIKDIRNPGW